MSWYLLSVRHAQLASLCLLAAPDPTLLLPSILCLALLPNLILFSYWPVRFFIKPITETNLHSV